MGRNVDRKIGAFGFNNEEKSTESNISESLEIA